MKKIIVLIIILLCKVTLSAQVEYVHLTNPVYDFLLRAETKGFLPNYSLSDLPLQRHEIVNALKMIKSNKTILNSLEQKSLERYLTEFEINERHNAVLIKSISDNDRLLSSKIFSNYEKLIYHYKDSLNSVTVEPLGSLELMYAKTETGSRSYNIIQGGGRVFGTLGKVLGFSLQATNGSILSGDRSLALEDLKYGQNIKFAILNSDIDFTNSHVIFQKNWFFASFEREDRILGAGLIQHPFLERSAPPMDAINVGVKFKYFKYKFTHAGLLGYVDTASHWKTGFMINIPPKYLVMHRFSITPSWGEIALWEASVYSNRQVDFAYINPLSFLKSIEHSLHDRDNSLMGLDFTIRPIKNIQIKSSFLLDDMVISEIGTGYWSNKTAFNLAVLTALPCGIDLGMEYARVEPYTFTHFNNQNSYTSDSSMIGSILLPNSDKTSIVCNWWFGGRYPLKMALGYIRHGDNEVDKTTGKVLRNVGGDPNYGHVFGDSETVTFLDGVRRDYISAELSSNYEIVRGINIGLYYQFLVNNEESEHRFRINFNLGDF
ncbi:MAG: hypothetical protein WCR42_12155 [bacterium]